MTKLNRLSSIFGAAIKSQPKPKPQSHSKTPKRNHQETFSELRDYLNSKKNAPADSFDEAMLGSKACMNTLTDGRFYVAPGLEKINDTENAFTEYFSIQWSSIIPPDIILISRLKKEKWIPKYSKGNCFGRLVDMYGQKVGNAAVDIFRKLERETAVAVEDYNMFIESCLDNIRHSDNEGFVVEQLSVIYKLLLLMKEKGFAFDKETYGHLLEYFIDMSMEEEFHFFLDVIKDKNDAALSSLGYYEMSLYIGVNKEEKIQELCHYISINDSDETAKLRENYLLALCDGDRKSELLHLFEVIDVTKVSSANNLARIFKSLGRLSLESYAERFLLTLKDHGYGADTISELIDSYAISVPNFTYEDVVSKFKNLHLFLEMEPHLKSYEEMVVYCCLGHKVHVALDVVHQICEDGLTISEDTLNFLLHSIEITCQFHLVHRIYSLIRDKDLKPTDHTFKMLISCYVKMKECDSAYAMLDDMKKFNLVPTASMYNVIMEGYFEENNLYAAKKVFNQLKLSGLLPDSQT